MAARAPQRAGREVNGCGRRRDWHAVLPQPHLGGGRCGRAHCATWARRRSLRGCNPRRVRGRRHRDRGALARRVVHFGVVRPIRVRGARLSNGDRAGDRRRGRRRRRGFETRRPLSSLRRSPHDLAANARDCGGPRDLAHGGAYGEGPMWGSGRPSGSASCVQPAPAAPWSHQGATAGRARAGVAPAGPSGLGSHRWPSLDARGRAAAGSRR
jgi:hypothetical protein